MKNFILAIAAVAALSVGGFASTASAHGGGYGYGYNSGYGGHNHCHSHYQPVYQPVYRYNYGGYGCQPQNYGHNHGYQNSGYGCGW